MDDIQTVSQDIEVVENENIDNSASTTEDVNNEVTNEDDNSEVVEGSQEDQVTFDERQQAKINSLIGEKVAKTHEERRRAEQLETELTALKARIPEPTVPEVPSLPNPNDYYGDPDGYNATLAQRDKAIQERAEFDTRNRLINDQRQAATRQAEFEEAQKQQTAIATYAEAAKSFGIGAEQMQKDAHQVMQIGIDPMLSDHIVSDPQGALITNYLAKNVLELDRMRSMSPMAASVYIANEVKPKLASAKKISSAPSPANVVGGGGAPMKVPSSIKGAKFE
tara:strand:+ start:862 stop:1701 length:840 start_codon:yes stop_codon:yes gene_type:complete